MSFSANLASQALTAPRLMRSVAPKMRDDDFDDWHETEAGPGVLSKTLRNVGLVVVVCLAIALFMGSSG